MRRIRNSKGFTLAETLIVVLIMGILTAAGSAAISAVMATRVGMIQVADAEILGSTSLQSLANELRFGQDITVDQEGNYVILDSTTYGTDTKFYLEKDKENTNYGKLKYGTEEGSHIFGESTYSGLSISDLQFIRNDDSSITIKLKVDGNKGELWQGELSVTPLNGSADEEKEPETL